MKGNNITFEQFYREVQGSTPQKGATVEQANAYYLDENYESYFVEYTGDVSESIRKTGLGDIFFFNKFFALLFVKKDSLGQLLQNVPEITNIERNFQYTLLPFKEEEAPPDLGVINKENITLNGEGVIVGIIGTGIDYLNPRFIKESGETRIVSIWDQDLIQGPKPETFVYGTEFTRENINDAIKTKGIGRNPYEIVNHKDEVGHGTAVAGVIGGRNLGANDLFKSLAPKCDFAIVKLKRAKKSNLALVGLEEYEGNVYDSNDLTAGMRYLAQLPEKLKVPMVVYITIGTNAGGHDGGSVAERYLDFFTNKRDFSMVTSTGGEGNTATHASGNLLETERSYTVEMKIGAEEKNLVVSIYTVRPDRIFIGLTSPMGDSIEKIDIPFFNGGEVRANLGQSSVFIQYFLEENGIGDQRIDIVFRNLYEGVWKINLIGDVLVNGQYNCWMQQRELLKGDTRFLKPNAGITLMTPSTANNALVCSSYNQIEGTVLPESGRGFTRDGRIKPQVAIAAKNILTTTLNNKNMVASGPAMSGAILAGLVALLFQWGIVRKNDINLFPQKIASYLIGGAERKEGVPYPNEREGFGVFNFSRFFNGLGNGARSEKLSFLRNKERISNSNSDGEKFYEVKKLREMNEGSSQIDIFKNYYLNEEYENYIVDFTGNIFESFKNIDYGVVYFSDNFAAIVSIKKGMVEKLLEDIPEIINIQKSYVYNFSNIKASNEPYAPLTFDRSGLNLEGQEVIVGIISTGIDYLNERFITQDERSRIISIWDQTIDTGPAAINTFGTEFPREKINEAIRVNKEGGNPYLIVPHRDTSGYGTAIAGVIGARNLGGNDDLISIVPRCEFAVVKIKGAKNSTLELNGVYEKKGNVYETTDIALGLNFLSSIQLRERKPMVVYVPLGSNCGGHDGSDALERYIDFLTTQRGFVVVTNSGNQGNTSTHTNGIIPRTEGVEVIEVNIGEGETNFCMGIFLNPANRTSLGIVAPDGEKIERIPAPLGREEIVVVNLQNTVIEIIYLIQEQSGGNQAILISMKGVRSGIWQIRLLGDSILGGLYNAWMLQRELLNPATRFLRPQVNTTLMIPSTANSILTGSYYNEIINKVPEESGRGYTRDARIKPGLGVGGTNILTIGNDGRYVVASGDAIAGGIFAGVTAVMLQWGIVQRNDINMFPARLRNYLIAGATRQEGVEYPNREVGYGILSLDKVFKSLSEATSKNIQREENSKEQDEQGLYVSIPKEIYSSIVKKVKNFQEKYY